MTADKQEYAKLISTLQKKRSYSPAHCSDKQIHARTDDSDTYIRT